MACGQPNTKIEMQNGQNGLHCPKLRLAWHPAGRGGTMPIARELSEWEPAPVINLELEADTVVDRLWTLGEELQEAPPARLRELVRQMVTRIDLRFNRTKQGRRTLYPFAGGKVSLRPSPLMYRLVSRGDWI